MHLCIPIQLLCTRQCSSSHQHDNATARSKLWICTAPRAAYKGGSQGREPQRHACRRRRHPHEGHSCWRRGKMVEAAGGGAVLAVVGSGGGGDGVGGGDGAGHGRGRAEASRRRRRAAARPAAARPERTPSFGPLRSDPFVWTPRLKPPLRLDPGLILSCSINTLGPTFARQMGGRQGG